MPVADADLRGALEDVLGRPVGAIARQPNAYCSSFAVEDVQVTLDGEPLALIFKDLAASALAPAARGAKPVELLDPAREIEAYLDLLGPAGLDVPGCLGAVNDPEAERWWLFLEAVDGVPLWQLGEPRAWEEAACWLVGLHAHPTPARSGHLLDYDAAYFRGWIDRAVQFAPDGALDAVAAGWERVVGRVCGWPRAVVHGEFYPSNLLVLKGPAGPRVVPVDWEMAGIGPGLLDLAALTSGRWTRTERERLALAYRDALPAAARPATDDLLDALAHCRLLIAVQWLGWSEEWSPPVEHAHDWLTEALTIAQEIGL